ncbi:hypothetical protein C5167_020662 [Papaver somniferum]|uniref:Uncharacterized protein n=1 Tax=Papaver somniferum TaxID=3469 RepID=A0A4Y7IXM9_PAPSO|nr:hypothetical protein C5167_020662 [Papaver somniferum]
MTSTRLETSSTFITYMLKQNSAICRINIDINSLFFLGSMLFMFFSVIFYLLRQKVKQINI